MSEHWAVTLYRRYVELYGDAVEQPIPRSTQEPEENKNVRA
jgi:hypothetical protein